MSHGEGVAVSSLKRKREPHGRKAPRRPRGQKHERRKHRKRLDDEIVAEARAEHCGDCRDEVGRVRRVGHVGCFEHKPTKQCEKCSCEARTNEAQAGSLDRVGFRANELQSLRGNEPDGLTTPRTPKTGRQRTSPAPTAAGLCPRPQTSPRRPWAKAVRQ